jgi:threonyl-tRNA synthetase
MLIVGEKEVAERKVAVRKHGKGDVGVMTIPEFAGLLQEEIENDFKKENIKEEVK